MQRVGKGGDRKRMGTKGDASEQMGLGKLYPCLWTKFCFMNQAVLGCCVLYSLCARMWNGSKENTFICSVSEEKHPFSRVLLRCIPFVEW